MRTLLKAIFIVALALGLASTIAAGTQQMRSPTALHASHFAEPSRPAGRIGC